MSYSLRTENGDLVGVAPSIESACVLAAAVWSVTAPAGSAKAIRVMDDTSPGDPVAWIGNEDKV